MTGANDFVFLLTSTEDPYFRDALDLMFLPSSIRYRFRYNRKWVSEEFKLPNGQFAKTKVERLVGKRAIIVHILTERKNDDYRILEFLPIREALINEAIILGEFLWLNFTLGNWILYHKDVTGTGVNEYHKAFRDHTPPDSRDAVKRLIFLTESFKVETISDNPETENIETLSNWTRIVGHMSSFSTRRRDSSKNAIFMKLVRVKDMTANKILYVKALDPDKHGFEFESEHSYAIDILEYTNRKVEPFELEIKTQAQTISPTLGKSEVRGKYDMLRFLVYCEPADQDRVSTLLFEPTNADFLISRTLVWIKIKTRKWRYFRIPLLTFAISTFVASEQFFRVIAGQTVDYWALLFGVIGTIGSTIGLMYLKK